jgi:hypothetical protein
VKTNLVKFLTDLLTANLIQNMPFFGLPILNKVSRFVIEQAVSFAATKGGLVLFMINTKVFTTSQASDYLTAISKLKSAPNDISDSEWRKLEEEANAAFINLISFSR